MDLLFIRGTNKVSLRLETKNTGLEIKFTDYSRILVRIGAWEQFPRDFVDALTQSLELSGDHIIRPDGGMFGLSVSHESGNEDVIIFAGQFTEIIQLNLTKDQVSQVISFIKEHFGVQD